MESSWLFFTLSYTNNMASFQPTGHQELRMTIFCVIALSNSLKSNFYSQNCHISILVYSQSWSGYKKHANACKCYIIYLRICVQKDWEAVWLIWCQPFTLGCDTPLHNHSSQPSHLWEPFCHFHRCWPTCSFAWHPRDRDAQWWRSIMPCLSSPHHEQGASLLSSITVLSDADPPTNTSLPISISCLPDTNLQRGYHLPLIPSGPMCSNPTLFSPENWLERPCMLSTVSLAGAGRANFLPPSMKHRTTSQGLVCTLISGTVISGVSCFWWCQCSFNGKNN